ncbi:MAG: DUF72 domain-containing protein [Segetibacter sp.]
MQKDLILMLKILDHFMQTIAHMGNKKGCLLVQFPPALKIEKMDQLQNLLISIKCANPRPYLENSYRVS